MESLSNSREFEESAFGAHSSNSRQRQKLFSFVLRLVVVLFATGLVLWIIVPRLSNYSPPLAASSGATEDQVAESSTALEQGAIGLGVACGSNYCFQKRYVFPSVPSFTLRNLLDIFYLHSFLQNSGITILAGTGQEADVVVDFSFNTTEPRLAQNLLIAQNATSLIIDYRGEGSAAWKNGRAATTMTQTKVYLRDGLTLENMELESQVLGIDIPPGVDIWSNSTKVKLSAGSLHADPLFNSRHVEITVAAGSITGTYPLDDVLKMQAQAGSILPEIIPRAADPQNVQPAILFASSQAGQINIECIVADDVPQRDYQTTIRSQMGRISGTYIHGSMTSLSSQMGDIEAEIIPYLGATAASSLQSRTSSGRQLIVVRPPYNGAGRPLTNMIGDHFSGNGDIIVQYSRAWEGMMQVTSQLGRLAAIGRDLHIISQKISGVGGSLLTQKGAGRAKSRCATQRGNVKFIV